MRQAQLKPEKRTAGNGWSTDPKVPVTVPVPDCMGSNPGRHPADNNLNPAAVSVDPAAVCAVVSVNRNTALTNDVDRGMLTEHTAMSEPHRTFFSETCDERALPLVGSRGESVWKGGSRGGVAGGWNAACQSLVKWYIPGHPLLSPPAEFNHWNQPRHHRFPRHQAHRPGRMPTGTVSDRVRGPCDTRRG